jgi:hypothetical protein
LSAKFGLGIKAVRPEGVFLFPKFGTQMALKNEYSLDFLVLLYQNKRTRKIFKMKTLFQESPFDSKLKSEV